MEIAEEEEQPERNRKMLAHRNQGRQQIQQEAAVGK